MASHESSDPVLTHSVPAFVQGSMHPRAAVRAAAFGMHRADLCRQRFVLALTLATLARAPGVITGSRDSIEPAHHRNVVFGPVYLDELEDFRFRPEANRMAFFRSSCSSRRILVATLEISQPSQLCRGLYIEL